VTATQAASLLDEASQPSVRALLGEWLGRSRRADFALARLRLAGVDLSSGELAGLRSCRVLLGRLDAEMFGEAAEMAARDARHRGNLEVLRDFLASGRVAVRVARAETWTPDFAVLAGAGRAGVAVLGAYHLAQAYPSFGPRFTCFLERPDAVRRLAGRFAALWGRAYPVDDVIRVALGRVLRP
jgi:hypothetical protein